MTCDAIKVSVKHHVKAVQLIINQQRFVSLAQCQRTAENRARYFVLLIALNAARNTVSQCNIKAAPGTLPVLHLVLTYCALQLWLLVTLSQNKMVRGFLSQLIRGASTTRAKQTCVPEKCHFP